MRCNMDGLRDETLILLESAGGICGNLVGEIEIFLNEQVDKLDDEKIDIMKRDLANNFSREEARNLYLSEISELETVQEYANIDLVTMKHEIKKCLSTAMKELAEIRDAIFDVRGKVIDIISNFAAVEALNTQIAETIQSTVSTGQGSAISEGTANNTVEPVYGPGDTIPTERTSERWNAPVYDANTNTITMSISVGDLIEIYDADTLELIQTYHDGSYYVAGGKRLRSAITYIDIDGNLVRKYIENGQVITEIIRNGEYTVDENGNVSMTETVPDIGTLAEDVELNPGDTVATDFESTRWQQPEFDLDTNMIKVVSNNGDLIEYYDVETLTLVKTFYDDRFHNATSREKIY